MKQRTAILVTCLFVLPAAANINWVWVNAGTGTEQGTFLTDGDLVGYDAPAGNYSVLDFSVTASAHGAPIGSVSGGEYYIGSPDVGFQWDGSAPTQFWRSNGAYTNGFAFWVTGGSPPDLPDYILFDIGYFSVENDEFGDVFLYEFMTVQMDPHEVAVGSQTFGALKALY